MHVVGHVETEWKQGKIKGTRELRGRQKREEELKG